MALDPVVAEMLKQMAEAEAPALNEMSPEDGRAMYRLMSDTMPQVEINNVSDRNIPVSGGEIAVRIYRHLEDKQQPCLVYYHGGGWVIGDLETHDSVCRQLARQTDYTIVSVDYRLAPEHPFPVPLNDCYEALVWVQANATDLGIDIDRIAVGGDSAGGNLSTCVCLKAIEESGPALMHQLLIYPVTDTNFETSSYKENRDGYMLTLDSMKWFWDHYLPTDKNALNDPLAVPMRASDLSKLPPATVITAEFDPLRDEGEAYGKKMNDAGVLTKSQRFDGMIHGFFGMTHILEGSREAMRFAVSELKLASSAR